MRHTASILLLAAMAAASGGADAGTGLSSGRAGLGLKSQPDTMGAAAFGGEAAHAWQTRGVSDYSLYGGARELPLSLSGGTLGLPRAGLRPVESYMGVAYALPGGWGASLEAGYLPESAATPRRYTLTGQLHTALTDGRMLSVGLKYRFYDSDAAPRPGMAGEAAIGGGYTLVAPYGVPGMALAPSYQLQFSYQHSAASTFGMALGRDLETFTPYMDVPGGPRQITFTGRYSLTPSWALSYDVLSQDAASPLRLQGLRLGVRYRF